MIRTKERIAKTPCKFELLTFILRGSSSSCTVSSFEGINGYDCSGKVCDQCDFYKMPPRLFYLVEV